MNIQQQAEEIFFHAVDLNLEERKQFLLTQCQEDSELWNEVEELFALDRRAAATGFLTPPKIQAVHVLANAWEKQHAAAELPEKLGRYELNEKIGQGGFAEVWRAFDPQLKRAVAVKTPHAAHLLSPFVLPGGVSQPIKGSLPSLSLVCTTPLQT